MSELLDTIQLALLGIVLGVLSIIGLRRSNDDKDWFDQDGK